MISTLLGFIAFQCISDRRWLFTHALAASEEDSHKEGTGGEEKENGDQGIAN